MNSSFVNFVLVLFCFLTGREEGVFLYSVDDRGGAAGFEGGLKNLLFTNDVHVFLFSSLSGPLL